MDLGRQSLKRRRDSVNSTGSSSSDAALPQVPSKRLRRNAIVPNPEPADKPTMKIKKHLSPPIQSPISANTVETSAASQDCLARCMQFIAGMEARLRDSNGRMRELQQRKKDIDEALARLTCSRAWSLLDSSDMAACIERVNVLVVHDHNKCGASKQRVEPVAYPSHVVAAMRDPAKFCLEPTPSELVLEGLKLFMLWPLEFQYRLPMIRKLQLEDLARGYLEQCRTQERSQWFEEEWATWCLRHNGAMSSQDPDYLDVNLLCSQFGEGS
ncbi:hypothetical protein PRZ48_012792 [Zasmidium cellare]|uniref:Uncharacterized protein n=1 Tax=Zasmidium cellare TaxID=395010 RepID=A0ABR0E6C5_ZASCE|nr:hypothetical protein PRZ48_012792 [Zasmidium cellare]